MGRIGDTPETLTFEQAMAFTRTVSSNAAFEDEECHAYFDILNSLKKFSPHLNPIE